MLAHARKYLAAKGVTPETPGARECRFCHTEFAPPQVDAEISQAGFGTSWKWLREGIPKKLRVPGPLGASWPAPSPHFA